MIWLANTMGFPQITVMYLLTEIGATAGPKSVTMESGREIRLIIRMTRDLLL